MRSKVESVDVRRREVKLHLACGHVLTLKREDAEERVEDAHADCPTCPTDEVVVRPSPGRVDRFDVVRVRPLTPELKRDCAYCGCGGPGTHVCGECRRNGIDGLPLEEEVVFDYLSGPDAELEGIGLAEDEGIEVRIENGRKGR